MSDVVAAALIAAGVGVIGNAVTFAVAITTTARQTKADADRLRAEHREDDRRLRRDAYARLLNALERLDAMNSAYIPAPTLDALEAWLMEFRAASVGVQLVASPEVAEARKAIADVLDSLTQEVMERTEMGQPMNMALGVPYVQTRPRLNEVGKALGKAMREDLAYHADADQAWMRPQPGSSPSASSR